YFSETRGALLGLIGGLIVAALYIVVFARDPQTRTMRKYSLYAIGAIAVLVVGFLLIKNTSFVKNNNTLARLASISLVDKTTQARFMIWAEAWQGFKEKP